MGVEGTVGAIVGFATHAPAEHTSVLEHVLVTFEQSLFVISTVDDVVHTAVEVHVGGAGVGAGAEVQLPAEHPYEHVLTSVSLQSEFLLYAFPFLQMDAVEHVGAGAEVQLPDLQS